MNQKLATEVNRCLKSAFPSLEGLWYLNWHAQMGSNTIGIARTWCQ